MTQKRVSIDDMPINDLSADGEIPSAHVSPGTQALDSATDFDPLQQDPQAAAAAAGAISPLKAATAAVSKSMEQDLAMYRANPIAWADSKGMAMGIAAGLGGLGMAARMPMARQAPTALTPEEAALAARAGKVTVADSYDALPAVGEAIYHNPRTGAVQRFIDGKAVSDAPGLPTAGSTEPTVPYAEGGAVESPVEAGPRGVSPGTQAAEMPNEISELMAHNVAHSVTAHDTPAPSPEAIPDAGLDVARPVDAGTHDNQAAGMAGVWQLTGDKPVWGHLPHSEVHDAIASGQYAFDISAPVNVISPDGQLGTLPADQAHEAFNSGYSYATPSDIQRIKYGTVGQTAIAAAEALGRGIAGPLATGAEVAFGVKPEDIAGRRAEIGAGGTALEIGAMIAPALVTGGASLAGRLGVQGAAKVAAAATAAEAYTLGGQLTEAGRLAASVVGLGEAVTPLARIGSAAVKGAVETGLYNAQDMVGARILGQPTDGVAMAVMHGGLAGGVLGGILGGAGVVGGGLWRMAKGSETAKVLSAVTAHGGGIESATSGSKVLEALELSGLDIAPTDRMKIAGDPVFQRIVDDLMHTTTNKSGAEVQAARANTLKTLQDYVVDTIGVPREAAESMIASGWSKNTYGNLASKIHAEEIERKFIGEKVPGFDKSAIELFEDYSESVAGKALQASTEAKAGLVRRDLGVISDELKAVRRQQSELIKESQVAQAAYQKSMAEAAAARGAGNSAGVSSAEMAAAGARKTMDDVSSRHTAIMKRIEALEGEAGSIRQYASAPGDADRIVRDLDGWYGGSDHKLSPKNPATKLYQQVREEVGALTKVGDLKKYVTAMDATVFKNLSAPGDLKQAWGAMRGIIREHEGRLVEKALGEGQGSEAVAALRAARDKYREIAELKRFMEDKMPAIRDKGVSVKGWADHIRELADTDAEAVMKAFANKADAKFLEVLGKEFPATAAAVKQYHLMEFLSKVVKDGVDGPQVNADRLVKMLTDPKSMTKEMREFLFDASQLDKLGVAGKAFDALKDAGKNFSNTAPVLAKLMQHIPGQAVGLVSAVVTHNPLVGFVVGPLVKALGKDMPDAAKLALLKFLGTDAPVNSMAFKSMSEFIHNAIKGEAVMSKSVKNLFRDGPDALPEGYKPSAKDIERLDKRIAEISENPEKLMDMTDSQLGHYMPEQAAELSATVSNTVGYLNSIRPTPKVTPFGTEMPVSQMAQQRYERALAIAHQPLVLMDHIKKGTITSRDVATLQAVYPAVYEALQKSIYEEMATVIAKGGTVPYRTKQALSIFMGQALDGTMTPMAISGAQPIAKQQAAAEAAQGGGQTAKKSANALNKLPGAAQTQGQASEARKTKT